MSTGFLRWGQWAAVAGCEDAVLSGANRSTKSELQAAADRQVTHGEPGGDETLPAADLDGQSGQESSS